MLSLQEFFNIGYTGVVKQGALALVRADFDASLTNCVYFDNTTGNRCLVGHVIKDNYDPQMEGSGLCNISEPFSPAGHILKSVCEASGMNVNDADFLDKAAQLQRAHDAADTLQEFKEEVAVLAEKFGLTIPEVV
jgi:hypothetical protein